MIPIRGADTARLEGEHKLFKELSREMAKDLCVIIDKAPQPDQLPQDEYCETCLQKRPASSRTSPLSASCSAARTSLSRSPATPKGRRALLTGPRTTAFANFVHRRCTGYSTKYPLGLRYHRDGGPAFDPNDYADRPHPAVSPDLCFKQTEGEKEKLQRHAPASK